MKFKGHVSVIFTKQILFMLYSGDINCAWGSIGLDWKCLVLIETEVRPNYYQQAKSSPIYRSKHHKDSLFQIYQLPVTVAVHGLVGTVYSIKQ